MKDWLFVVDKKETKLRVALANDDNKGVADAIVSICNEVITHFESIEPRVNHTVDVEYLVEVYREFIEEFNEALNDGLDIEDDDEMNYYLTELYDLCDNTNIFVALSPQKEV